MPALRRLELPCLTNVTQDFRAAASISVSNETMPLTQLTGLDLRSLTSARDLNVHADAELALLAAQDFGGGLCVNVSKLLAPELARVRGRFCAQGLQYVPSLSEVDELLGCPSTSIPLTRARQVTISGSCSYDGLTSVDRVFGSDVRIENGLVLGKLVVTMLPNQPSAGKVSTTIAGVQRADQVVALVDHGPVQILGLAQAGHLSLFASNPNYQNLTAAARSARLPDLESAGTLVIGGPDQTPYVDVPALREVTDLRIYTTESSSLTAATDHAFPALQQAGKIMICDRPPLGGGANCRIGALSFPSLIHVGVTSLQGWSDAIPPPSLPKLATLGSGPHSMRVAGALQLDMLTSVGGDMSVEANWSFRAPVLTQLTTFALTIRDGQTTSFGAPLRASATTIESVGSVQPVCGQCRALTSQLAQPQSTTLTCQSRLEQQVAQACP